MTVLTGLDQFVQSEFKKLRGQRVGALINQATIDREGRHFLELFQPHKIFGPQHGLFGHTQDNMIEWEPAPDPRYGAPVYSLYGATRQPPEGWLSDLDVFLIDLPDIGSRYYTFAWTSLLCLEMCAKIGLPVVVLDRPNPLGPTIEGPGIESGYESFVGLRSIPIRHGLTLGELLLHFRPKASIVEVVSATGVLPGQLFPGYGLPWGLPSPNMPSFHTALVYPGACLLEGTHLSEGRGTTRPFEIVGAPWIDGQRFASVLNQAKLPGVHFRAHVFQPTFHKHAGRVCEGVFVHVTDATSFRPVQTYTFLLKIAYRDWVDQGEPVTHFASLMDGGAWNETACPGFWKQPPYEYEYEKMPIDILWGSPSLRLDIGAIR